jgi:hypothetical protein
MYENVKRMWVEIKGEIGVSCPVSTRAGGLEGWRVIAGWSLL